MILLSNGLRGPPCGVPSWFTVTTPFSIIPIWRNLRMSFRVDWSSMLLATIDISFSCWTVSKNFSKSMSTYPLQWIVSPVLSLDGRFCWGEIHHCMCWTGVQIPTTISEQQLVEGYSQVQWGCLTSVYPRLALISQPILQVGACIFFLGLYI
jgi:hypothetical protein